jgi:hypothetical protein
LPATNEKLPPNFGERIKFSAMFVHQKAIFKRDEE